jgi:hypothetical protein
MSVQELEQIIASRWPSIGQALREDIVANVPERARKSLRPDFVYFLDEGHLSSEHRLALFLRQVYHHG